MTTWKPSTVSRPLPLQSLLHLQAHNNFILGQDLMADLGMKRAQKNKAQPGENGKSVARIISETANPNPRSFRSRWEANI